MMRKIRIPGIFLALIPAVLALVGTAAGAAEFSADMIQKANGQVVKGRVFVKGNDFRQEMTVQGRTQTMIFKKDRNVVWMLMPENRMYMEMNGSSGAAGMSRTDPGELARSAERKYLGKETVNGYVCDKYRYMHRDASQGTTLQWISKKLNFPVKTETGGKSGRMVVEYRNIKEGRQPASLFRVPEGYRKMSMPGMPGMGR